jgi:hypothetical protein
MNQAPGRCREVAVRRGHPRQPAVRFVNRLAVSTLTLSILLAGEHGVARPSPPAPAAAHQREAGDIDHFVFPTGHHPTDVQNVQAAVDLGGTVLLKAVDTAGRPTSFNFGAPGPDDLCGYQVAIQGDVQLLGEAVGSARTTITGGYRPILVGLTGWCGDYSPFSGRVAIRGIDFEGNQQSAIDIYKSRAVRITDTRISNVVASLGIATGINVFGGGAGRRISGNVVIRDNVIRYRAMDAGWSHAIVLDDVGADVDVLHNEIETTQEFSGILVVRQVEGTVRIAGNTVVQDLETPGSGAGIYIYANDLWNEIRTSAPRYEVVENRIVTELYGIGLVGQRGSIDGPVIRRNRITTRGSLGLAEGIFFGGNVSNARVSKNSVEGAGAYGIDVFAFEPGQLAEANMFERNDLTLFDAGTADVFLDAHTQNHTVVADPLDSVVDLGNGNQIIRRRGHPGSGR